MYTEDFFLFKEKVASPLMVQLLPEEYERLHREFVNAGTLDILEIAERIPIEPTKQNSPNAVVDLYMI